jgi:hypothetical protein
MTEPARALPAPRIRPIPFLWVLVVLGAATLSAPADIAAALTALRVPDPDDAMRLVEVRDLVQGQGWFDLVQHRFGPPGGIVSHWSRLVDAPLAGLILALSPLVGRSLAEGLAAVLWPILLLCLYGLVLYRGVRANFGPLAAVVALLVATQTMGVAVQFAPGRVDHHGVQLIVILGLALAIVRGSGRAGFVAGVLAALSLAVGLEGLPFVAMGAVFLAADWALRGRPALPAFAGFGLGLGLAAPLLFGGQTDPGRWVITACDALSPPWLYLAVGGLGLTLACAGLDCRLTRPAHRLAALAGLGAIFTGGFAAFFPTCLAGPFTGMSPLVREHWLLKVNEMTSLATFVARGQWEALAFHPVVLLATLAATWLALRDTNRRPWAVVACLLWPGALLCLQEFRGLYVVSGLVPFVAGGVLARVLTRADGPDISRWRRWGGIAVGAGLVSALWIPVAVLGESVVPPAPSAADPQSATACLSADALAPLATLPPGTILAPIFMGPSILLHTPHRVVAAPYHRAVPEIAAALQGLGGTEADLRRAVEAYGVRYVATCPARPADDLQSERAFATRLTRGEVAAAWLEPVPVEAGLKVWRVMPF